jgi:hypothetical protein
MPVAVMVLEFKGFTGMAEVLAKNTEAIGITSARVRAAGISIVNDLIQKASSESRPIRDKHIGGDTWVFEFASLDEGLIFGCSLLHLFTSMAVDHAVFFLKPCIALGWGDPKWTNDRPIDDLTIAAYTVADKGRPYTLFLIGDAIDMSRQFSWLRHDAAWGNAPVRIPVMGVDWQSTTPNAPSRLTTSQVWLPSLLLDSDVMFFESIEGTIAGLIREQEKVRSIFAFGGPAPLDAEPFREYVAHIIQMLRTREDFRLTVLACLPLSERRYSFAWLELVRRLAILYPSRMALAAFTIPPGQARPTAYHVYDQNYVHIGLRSFVPHRGIHSMTSSIMVRNQKIARSFTTALLEDWKLVGPLDEKRYAELSTAFAGMSTQEKQELLREVDHFCTG